MLPSPVNTWRRGHYIVYGIGFDDAVTGELARRVMLVSMLMALLALASSIIQLFTGAYWSVGFMAAVVVPLCGYYGALKRSRFMLNFFWLANGCFAISFLVAFLASTSMEGDYVTCACNERCRREYGIPKAQAERICENPGRYRALYWVGMGLALAMMSAYR
jgi:hypothetical protein